MSDNHMPSPPRDTMSLRCRVNPREIAYLTAIFEGYPGYALLRTDDAKMGLVQFWIAPDFYQDVMNIIHDLQKEINLVILDE